MLYCIFLIVAVPSLVFSNVFKEYESKLLNNSYDLDLNDDNKVPVKVDGKILYIHSNIPKEARLYTPKLIESVGHKCEEFDLTTEDGYILKLFHIANNGSKDLPILMMHGFLDSSDTFLIRRSSSMAINLTNSGYDVWLGNIRGNKYGRRHVSLDPDVDKKFWEFSFHENGIYDYPVIIDVILNKTGQSQLIIVGHSQGNLNTLVLGTMKPEYNKKIKLLIALAPIFYTQHFKGLSSFGFIALPLISTALEEVGAVEVFNQNSTLRRFVQNLCTETPVGGYALCAFGGVSLFAGFDPEELELEFFPVLLGHYFAGTSAKNLQHFGQFADGHSGLFDYGPVGNLKRYNSTVAPLYDIKKFTPKTVLLVGAGDNFASVSDTLALHAALPNSVYFLLPRPQFNHIDFVWGRHMEETLFPYFYKYLNKYK